MSVVREKGLKRLSIFNNHQSILLGEMIWCAEHSVGGNADGTPEGACT